MTHASISHATRGTLEFRQPQMDADQREAVADIFQEIGTERDPLVHIRARNRQRSIRGIVTGPRRAEDDSNTTSGEWRQALANYVDELESHCDEFQGFGSDGYSFTDDIRSESFPVVFESVDWTLSKGQPWRFEYDISLLIGQGVMGVRGRSPRNPTVDSAMTVAARVDGNDLPGLREFESVREIEYEPNALYGSGTATNNDVLATDGLVQRFTFRGTHTGSNSARATADSNLQALIGAGQVTLETKWPGYDIQGYVTRYNSDFETRYGSSRHNFELEFVEGVPA